jgi:hypothetical protein
MKYVQSFFPYEVNFNGVVIPKKDYSIFEKEAGKRNIIGLEDDVLELLQEDGYFNDILKNGKYRILNNMPSEYKTSGDFINELNSKLAEKDKEIALLKNNVVKDDVENDEIVIEDTKKNKVK